MKPYKKTDQRRSKKDGAQRLAGEVLTGEIETEHNERTARDWDSEQPGDAEAVHQEQRPIRHDPLLEDPNEGRE